MDQMNQKHQKTVLFAKVIKMKQKIIIPILMLSFLCSIAFAQVEGNATLLGWAYEATGGSSLVNVTYNYSSLLTWITDESQLDLFYWNGSDWLSLGATLDTNADTLITEQDTSNFPRYFVLGEKNETDEDDALAYWQFDSCSGLNATDLSGNEHHGTLKHYSAWLNLSYPEWTSGYLDQGIRFPPVDNQDYNTYIDIEDSATDQDFNLSSQFTIEFWMYSENKSKYNGLQTILGRGGFNDGYRIVFYNGRLNFQVDGEYPGGNDLMYYTTLSEDQWYHVALTFDKPDDNMSIYVDGALKASRDTPRDPRDPGTKHLLIGGYDAFAGKLDEIKIYNYTRTPEQIAADAAESISALGCS